MMIVVDRFTGFFKDVREGVSAWELQKLISSTPLLVGYEYPITSRVMLRKVKKKNATCVRVGHLWTLVGMKTNTVVSSELRMESTTELSSYTVRCSRCFPHIHSQAEILSYNPFPYIDSLEG